MACFMVIQIDVQEVWPEDLCNCAGMLFLQEDIAYGNCSYFRSKKVTQEYLHNQWQ